MPRKRTDPAPADVELSEEEQQAALDEALTKKAAAVLAQETADAAEAEAEKQEQEKADKEAAEAVDRTANPAGWFGVDLGGSVGYVTYASIGADVRSRSLQYGGANYEHVAEDAEGVWLYRQM